MQLHVYIYKYVYTTLDSLDKYTYVQIYMFINIKNM